MKHHALEVRIPLYAILLMVAVCPVFAHHSNAMFDMTKQIVLEGTVTEVDWANPHSLVFLDAAQSDKPELPVKNWSIQLMSPSALGTIGWERDSIKAGDKVKVTGFARKDGRAQILFFELTDQKGHHFIVDKHAYDAFGGKGKEY